MLFTSTVIGTISTVTKLAVSNLFPVLEDKIDLFKKNRQVLENGIMETAEFNDQFDEQNAQMIEQIIRLVQSGEMPPEVLQKYQRYPGFKQAMEKIADKQARAQKRDKELLQSLVRLERLGKIQSIRK